MQLKPFHPTLIVDLNEDDTINRVKYALKNLIMVLVWLTIFFGATSVNLTETEQLVATTVITYWSTENPHANFSVLNTEERIMVWYGLS